MTKSKTTRRALLSSCVALMLCFSMLLGTTYAWFTDTASTSVNMIQAGTLKVDLVSGDKSVKDGTLPSLDFTDKNSNTEILWEPGVTFKTPEFKIVNKGNLHLKYQLVINGITGGNAKLLEAIDFTIGNEDIEAGAMYGQLAPNEATDTMVITGHMDENAGNEYQGLTIDGITVTVFATQVEAEYDSFTNDYDKGSAWVGEVGNVPAEENGVITITSAGELAALAADVNSGNSYNGKTIKLGANIDLNNTKWTPIGNSSNKFDGTFIGTGYTISNLYVTGSKGVGLFGYTWTSAHIEGVTIDGAYVSGNDYVGAVLGGGYLSANCIKDCVVKNAEIIATPYLMENGVYDGGAKAGAIVGQAYNGNLTGNKAINCKITAYRDLGGIAGMLYADGVTGRTLTASGNTVENVTLTYQVLKGASYDGNKVNENMGDVVGRLGRSSQNCNMPVVENNTVINVTRETVITWNDGGIVYKQDVDTGVVTLYEVTADYEGDTVEVAEGTTAIGNYAFANNSNVKTVVMADSVRDLGRGFDSSTVEKVVLNEGLETISSRAFRETTALKEVVISSTVKTIADNAFQKSGIKEIIIPATVETIGETAFGASKIETVTFEGNTSIQGYAFRGCPNLRTVYLNGNDVTFIASTLNGRNSTWFCNGESNNPNTSDITFYVVNDTVAARVKTAMGAEADNTTVIVYSSADTADELVEALENGKSVVLTEDVKIDPAGMSNAYGTTGINVKNGQTIDGNGNTLDIKGAGGTWDSGISTTGGLIKNITVTGSFRGIFINHTSTHSERVVLENVIIDGTTYTISCDQGTYQGLTATDSTFNGWTSYAATLGDAKFVNCSFGEGNGYAYCRPYAPTEFVGCEFEAGYTVEPVAAVTFENCTLDGVALTNANLAELVTSTANATVK